MIEITPLTWIVALIVGAGCARTFPEPASALDAVRSQTYDVPPKQMVQRVSEIVGTAPLNVPVTEVQDGTLLTDWAQYPGEWHIARRWQERSRYQITVIPDWNEPTGKARLEIVAETEQRATDGQEWKPAPELKRVDRAREVLRVIDANVKAGAAPAHGG
jgi:hypothetical protein